MDRPLLQSLGFRHAHWDVPPLVLRQGDAICLQLPAGGSVSDLPKLGQILAGEVANPAVTLHSTGAYIDVLHESKSADGRLKRWLGLASAGRQLRKRFGLSASQVDDLFARFDDRWSRRRPDRPLLSHPPPMRAAILLEAALVASRVIIFSTGGLDAGSIERCRERMRGQRSAHALVELHEDGHS